MGRASKRERAKRINTAIALIERYDSPAQAARGLANRYAISQRQAYRYVQEAQRVGQPVSMPERKIAFTVKLSPRLIQKLRQYAKSSGAGLSEIVTRALEDFLSQRSGRG